MVAVDSSIAMMSGLDGKSVQIRSTVQCAIVSGGGVLWMLYVDRAVERVVDNIYILLLHIYFSFMLTLAIASIIFYRT